MRVVIIGGGAVGSSIAYHLAMMPGLDADITVVERDPTYAKASSSLSLASIRQQFSTPVCITMSLFGLQFLRSASDLLAVDGDRPPMALREPGYLFLASEAGEGVLRENHAVQMEHGADVALLDPPQIAARYPWISTDGVTLGSLGLSGEGWFDGPGLLAAYRRRARSLGVRYVAQDCTGLLRQAGRVQAVQLQDGSELPCDIAVNAGGAWSSRIAGFAGIDLPVRARKRMVYVIETPADLPNCPLVIDPTGIFFRPEGRFFVTGRSPGPGEPDPDEPELVVEDAMFHDMIWPVIAARAQGLEQLRLTRSWAGYYEYNVFDQNGVIGAHPDCTNLIHAAGFSGHGMQHSPATGRGVAELIAHGAFATLDLSVLGWDRILNDTPLVERNIV
jgi:glycine/D-amino acid oxidase-like deaminating enzyme